MGIIKKMSRSESRERTRSLLLVDCITENDVESSESLLQKNVDVNNVVTMQTGERLNLLCHAILNGATGIAKQLIDYGADVNGHIDKNKTPLESAIFKNNKQLVEILINAGANIRGALIYACQYCNSSHVIDIVGVMLQNNANVNEQNSTGDTALHKAVANDFLDLVQLLVNSGAKCDIRNFTGQLPIEIEGREFHPARSAIKEVLVKGMSRHSSSSNVKKVLDSEKQLQVKKEDSPEKKLSSSSNILNYEDLEMKLRVCKKEIQVIKDSINKSEARMAVHKKNKKQLRCKLNEKESQRKQYEYYLRKDLDKTAHFVIFGRKPFLGLKRKLLTCFY